MLRESLRIISGGNFNALYCSECQKHFCVDISQDYAEHSIGCPYCGKRYIQEIKFTEVLA